MYLAMLKKDFKQFFRSKINVIILIIFPIVLITTLSIGLKDMINGESIFKEGDKDIVYYTMDERSKYKEGFLEFTKAVNESVKIQFKEVENLELVKGKVDNYEAIAYINFNGENIEYYSSENGEKTKGKIIKSIFESFLKEYGTYETIGTFNKEAFNSLVKNKYSSYVEEEKLTGAKALTAGDFYTFAELALIILFLGQTIGHLVYKEKELKTIDRIIISKSSNFLMMLSKISLGTLIATFQTILVYFYSSLILGVNWGENSIAFIILFIVFGAFASVVGAVVGILAENEGTVTGGLNIIIFVIGALGGCFTPLTMILSIPIISKLVYISPVYWISTATSTMISGFHSNAYYIAVAIPIILSLIFLGIYFIVTKKRGVMNNA